MTEFNEEKVSVKSEEEKYVDDNWYMAIYEDEEHVVDLQSARGEFIRFAKVMRIDLDTTGLDDNTRRDTEKEIRDFVREIQRGSLMIDEEGQPVYTPQVSNRTKPFTFYRPKGGHLVAIDKKQEHAKVAQSFAVLGEVVREPPVMFSNLAYSDTKVLQLILGLFLA